jgi:putative transposase
MATKMHTAEKIVTESWRRYYNTVRPHSSLGYRPSTPEALIWPAPKEIAKMKSPN